jgi:hypothetical protein
MEATIFRLFTLSAKMPATNVPPVLKIASKLTAVPVSATEKPQNSASGIKWVSIKPVVVIPQIK